MRMKPIVRDAKFRNEFNTESENLSSSISRPNSLDWIEGVGKLLHCTIAAENTPERRLNVDRSPPRKSSAHQHPEHFNASDKNTKYEQVFDVFCAVPIRVSCFRALPR